MADQPLQFHESFSSLLYTFQNVMAGMSWLKLSIKNAESYFEKWPYIITLACSVSDKEVKIDKKILSLVRKEGVDTSQLYTTTLINSYRIFTIAIKDIIWEESDFSKLRNKPELQFLRHIRNASAHNNKFYWGTGRLRTETINSLPVVWRGKEINKNIEHSPLYMNFLAPGDLFVLLADISKLVENKK